MLYTAEQALADNQAIVAWNTVQSLQESQSPELATRINTLRELIVTKARSISNERLKESMALIQAGDIPAALTMLERDQELANIAGIGERYQQLIERSIMPSNE